MSNIRFSKYHGLGNDYLVVHEEDLPVALTPKLVTLICNRNYGIGSDGILLFHPHKGTEFPVTILNPDGSEAENSGNGMRIAARFLFDAGLVGNKEFTLLAGKRRAIKATVPGNGDMVQVEMGKALFTAPDIPVTGPDREVLRETVTLFGKHLTYSCVSVGNPHCVVLDEGDLKACATTYGPHLEVLERFPNRINVQFARVLDRKNVQIEIWERGAGYTLASGSSSCAVAAVCRKLGHIDSSVTIQMPGGKLFISVDEMFNLSLLGPVEAVAEGNYKVPFAFANSGFIDLNRDAAN